MGHIHQKPHPKKSSITFLILRTRRVKSFKQFLHENDSSEKDKNVVVSVPEYFFKKFESIIINEGRHTKEIGNIPVHKDSPHVKGGEYHGHVDMPGGKQVTYTISGQRLHPNKFPNQVPQNVKKAIAQVLGVDPNILESYEAYDEIENSTVFLLEFKQTKAEQLIAILENAYSKE